MLNELDHIPEKLLLTPAGKLVDVLPGPTLIHLRGRRKEPLFVSVLLHGNEYSGWEVMRKFLGNYAGRELPRSLSCFIGNISAAKLGMRHLDGQPDYNRIWNGGDLPEHRLMQSVIESMKTRNVFASIDIHNNTGKNPHYACINKTGNSFINLARRFSRTIVYFIRPAGVQTAAFAEICPSVTLECGRPGEESGIRHALDYLEECIDLEVIPDGPVKREEIDLYHTIGTTKVKPGITLGINAENADLVLSEHIENMNMKEIAPGNVIAEQVSTDIFPVMVMDELGNDVAEEHFMIRNGKLINKRQIIPSMMTLKKDIIMDDCLCYLMEHYQI